MLPRRKPEEPGLTEMEQALTHLEPLDPRQVDIWRKMTPAQKLELVFQAYQLALEMVRATERQAHPDMPQEELNWHITRRMQGRSRPREVMDRAMGWDAKCQTLVQCQN